MAADDITSEELLSHWAWLRRLAWALVRNDEEADDAVQETWERALRRPPAVDSSPRPWLATVLRNVVSNRKRGARSHAQKSHRSELEHRDVLPTPEELLVHHEQLALLASMVKQLEEPYRSTLLLCYGEGLSPTEVANRLGVPAGTVRWRLKRGLDDIRGALDQRHGSRRSWLLLLAPIARPGQASTLLLGSAGKAGIALIVVLVSIGGALWWNGPGGRPPEGQGIGGSVSNEDRRRATGIRAESAALSKKGEESASEHPHFGPYGISGRVSDVGGGPIPGASLQFMVDGAVSAFQRDGRRKVPGESALPGETLTVVTDAEGRYTASLPLGRHRVMVAADGYASWRATAEVVGKHRRDFHLNPAAVLAGRVLYRNTGEPVVGAVVTALVEDAPAGNAGEARTDERGAFVVGALNPATYRLSARMGGFVGNPGSTIDVRLASHVDGLTIFVDGGRRVSGTVRRRNGDAIRAALVSLRDSAGEASTVSADDGSYLFEGVASGPLNFSVRASGFASQHRSIVIGAEDLLKVEFALEGAGTVSGRVLGPDGVAVEGALIHGSVVWAGRSYGLESQRTAVDGRFTISDVPPGTIEIMAEHPVWGGAALDSFTLAEDENKEVLLRLLRGVSISGQVRWDDGSPADALVVTASRWARTPLVRTTSDTDGRYRLSGFERGSVVHVRVVAHSPSGDPANFDGPASQRERFLKIDSDDDIRDVDFVLLKASYELSGIVLEPDGHPASGAVVTASPGGQQRTAADDGTFIFDGLVAGNYNVTVDHPGFPPLERDGVKAGTKGLRLELAASAILEGTVVDPNDQPVREFTLELARVGASTAIRSPPARLSLRGKHGRFAIENLAAGVYDLTVATVEGWVAKVSGVALLAGERRKDLKIRLVRGVELLGSVADWDRGAPVPSARVAVQLGGGTIEARTNASGRFRVLGGIPGGFVEMVIEADGYLAGRGRTAVPEGRGPVDMGTLHLLRARPPGPNRDGIGVVLELTDKGDVVVKAAPEALPAGRAGLRTGDIIRAIDGREIRDLSMMGVIHLLRSAPGTEIRLEIESAEGVRRSVVVQRS